MDARPSLLNRIRTLSGLQPLRNASVRTKLLLVALVPFLTVLPILFFLIFYWGAAYYDRLLTFKVSSDLAVAHEYFNHVQERVGSDVVSLGDAHVLVRTIEGADRARLTTLLQQKQDELKLDFLNFLDARGVVQAASRERGPGPALADHGFWPVVTSALQGQAQTEIDLYSEVQLAAINDGMARQAHIELVPTANAEPTTKSAVTSGMVIHAATPVRDADGRLLGVLEGGMLLNQNLDFVDTINSLVYAPGSLPAGSDGTATLFIDDVRVATNVRLFGEQRALGTRASQAVRQHVLGEGLTWLDRAFVVHDWYISAYEPITDSFGQRIGMLYVGYLEAPFREARQLVIMLLAGLFAVICVGGVFFSLRVARGIYLPLARMSGTMTAVQQGSLQARTGAVLLGDEIGKLSLHLDELLDTVQAQNAELKAWGEQLDQKVIERTAELEQANALLRQTQKQLILSEKLASIGEITAGVAHEINNPVAVLQGNLDVLREALGPHAAPVQAELQLMDQQIHRINTLVSKLLQFANPEDFAGYIEAIHVDPVIADSLVLVRHLLNQNDIAVVHRKQATCAVAFNGGELQQVLINLFTNAIHAMPHGGTLTIASGDWEEDGKRGVTITVADTGQGIRKEDQARIFDAFFTTKRSKGTGLGLSITYTLVARYGGTITVESEANKGSIFSLRLPAAD
ncbi:cache domain-containing protein [uncultured Oxalicibacterium sp.]|uniref:sensor histidine kinase n=1 Tax=uncultured Oxalicibacterium sp. TaxID=1168540 RepID=UPI0025EA7370|nr:cache domain-containing protein [uncultured Oxalicibacterium sp.]